MTFVSVFSHQVDTMAVFVPEGSLVGQSTVGDGDVIVVVESGEGAALVVRHGVAWRTGRKENNSNFITLSTFSFSQDCSNALLP